MLAYPTPHWHSFLLRHLCWNLLNQQLPFSIISHYMTLCWYQKHIIQCWMGYSLSSWLVFYQISHYYALISKIIGSCISKEFFKWYCFLLLHVQFRVYCGVVSIRKIGKCCIMTIFYELFPCQMSSRCQIFSQRINLLTYPILLWWSWECVLHLIISSEVWIINHCLG